MLQDRLLERAQRLACLEPELVTESASNIAQHLECLCLPACAVERDRQVHPQLLA